MAILKHEVWEDADGLPMGCLAGVDGDGARTSLDAGAKLIFTFDAASYFEAMTKYNAFLGREPYTTHFASDYEPYPDEWRRRQDESRTAD